MATVGMFAVAACGTDADQTATTTTSTTEAEQTNEAALAYCERAAEMDQNALPSDEQLQELVSWRRQSSRTTSR